MIRSIEIKGLRGIREGALSDLTDLVVLVGTNGCGKSTVLEALSLAAPNVPAAIGRAVRRHQGVNYGARWLFWRLGQSGSASVVLTTTGRIRRECKLSLDESLAPETTVVKCLLSEGQERASMLYSTQSVQISFGPGNAYTFQPDPVPSPLKEIPHVWLSEVASSEMQPLHAQYSRTKEEGRGQFVRDILAEVSPGLAGIEILTEGDSPIVHLVFENHSVPAALSGDGIAQLLRLTLDLASSRGGLVLIEEPELHKHPGAIRQAARVILATVRRGIQIVLTTHSLDVIDALLAEAKDEDLGKLSLFRLLLKEGKLETSRLPGPDVVHARVTIADDLR